MRELVDGLRDAASEPPPSSIDLDRLITGEARRRRFRRLGVAAVVAVAALVAVPVVMTTAGGSPPKPADGPPEYAVEHDVEHAVGQTATCPPPGFADPAGGDPAVLTAQVAPCLAAMLPGAALTDPDTARAGVWFTGNRVDRFAAKIRVDDDAGTGLLYFHYLLAPCQADASSQLCTGPSNCPRARGGGVECRLSPDGTKFFIQDGPVGPALNNQVNVYRPDGTYLQLVSTNSNDVNGFISDTLKVTATRAPLTVAQLIRIADAIHLDR